MARMVAILVIVAIFIFLMIPTIIFSIQIVNMFRSVNCSADYLGWVCSAYQSFVNLVRTIFVFLVIMLVLGFAVSLLVLVIESEMRC